MMHPAINAAIALVCMAAGAVFVGFWLVAIVAHFAGAIRKRITARVKP